jgi:hypothetical protein
LGEGFIDACLIHYDGNVENVIGALCEESLPDFLQQLDRNIPRYNFCLPFWLEEDGNVY